MTIRRCLRAALLILGIGWLAGPSVAEGPVQRHIPIPRGDGPVDFEAIFEQRLRELDARQDLTRLFKEEDLPKLIEQLKQSGIKLDDPRWKDPRWREEIQKLIGRVGPDGKPMQLRPEEFEMMKRLVDDMLKTGKPPEFPPLSDLGKLKPPPNPPEHPRPDVPPLPNPGNTAPVDPAAQAAARDQIMRWARRLEAMAREVRDSPTLQQAFRDMSQALLDMQSSMMPNGQRLDTQLAELNQMARDSREWFRDSFKSLGKFELPSLPRIDFPSMKMPGLSSLPTVDMPRGLSAMPSSSTAWKTILLVAGTVVLVLLAVKLLGRFVAANRDRLGSGWKLGPWPIDPSAVATREDVVLAFEYLSLLRLGYPAHTWNHREIADRLGGQTAERRALIAELANLYEQARYTPTDEPMPADSIALARCDLCLLAGVSAA